MITKLSIALMAIMMTQALSAATIMEGSAACVSEDLFSQLIQAIQQEDKHSAAWLAKNGCVITRKEFPATVLSRNLSGVWRIRAYADNGVILELWTPKDRVKE